MRRRPLSRRLGGGRFLFCERCAFPILASQEDDLARLLPHVANDARRALAGEGFKALVDLGEAVSRLVPSLLRDEPRWRQGDWIDGVMPDRDTCEGDTVRMEGRAYVMNRDDCEMWPIDVVVRLDGAHEVVEAMTILLGDANRAPVPHDELSLHMHARPSAPGEWAFGLEYTRDREDGR